MGFEARQAKGFTLIELLIVVVILSVLASIVVPQFGRSSDDANLAALDANLATLRTAIDMYTVEHGHYPGSVASVGTCAVGSNTNTATPGAAAFIAHLTQYTTAAGVACSQKDASSGGMIKYGPYLKKTRLPTNPITNDNHLEVIQTGALRLPGWGTDSNGGWRYDYLTGEIIADQPSYDDR